ncbi:MAG TPA: hypothetical protein VN132_06655, partial [Bdellovibrio sp.]|nr:hypothetical protein [Bdellovibrio sp.]
LNASQVDYLQTEVLQYAVASKQLLVRIGQKPALNGTVARLLKNMKIVYGGTKAKKTEQFVSSQKKLVDLLQYLQKN